MGTRFWFELSLPVAEGWFGKDESHEKTVIGVQGEPYKVLVVDDQQENRAVLCDFLGSLGFLIAEAANGEEGVIKGKQWQPDLILMDLMMPIMDGLEATRAHTKNA